MRARHIVRLFARAFDANVICEGPQLARLVTLVEAACPGVAWYISDAEAIGLADEWASLVPRRIGDSAATAGFLRSIVQFESCVLSGVTKRGQGVQFREGGVCSEDRDDADLGDAVVEIRAFDFTVISVLTELSGVMRAVMDALPRAVPVTGDGPSA